MGIVGVIYAGTAVALLIEGEPWRALMFAGYGVAQVGIMFDTMRSW